MAPLTSQHALSLLLYLLCVSAEHMETVGTPELTCSQGLADCRVSSGSGFTAPLPDPRGPMNVSDLQLKVVLCCWNRQECKPCLRIVVSLQEVNNESDSSGESGDDSDEEGMKQMTEGSINICLSSPGSQEICKRIQWKSNHSLFGQHTQHELVLTEKVQFGAPVVVSARSKKAFNFTNITVPSLKEVCSMEFEGSIKECDVPRLRAVTDQERNVVSLQLENTENREEEVLWQMVWNERSGEVLQWPKEKNEEQVASNSVAPCLCFKVWWKGEELQGQYCPFKHQQDVLENMRHNMTVSMEESQTREGDAHLSWNVTAPCGLDAEVWLCKKDFSGGPCEEVTGSRQKLHAGWTVTHSGYWQAGEFSVPSHPLLCVQTTIKGMMSYVEPQCPFEKTHSRWGLALLVGLLLVCLAVLGAYFIQGILKGYVWRWLKEEDVKGAVGGGHVVLLYSPDDDQGFPGLLCHLGSCLQALGFSVSLDLWSQAELCVLGPVPWLHSRLDRLQRQGGKVVLVLTQAAWTRAEEWGARSWERNNTKERNVKEEGEGGRSCPTACADVFGASLNCILADYLQGRAGERFMLVQFESLPPEPPGSFRPLPQLFRGLHVYSLPSQSLGFLTELAGARQMATASARRKRAGGLRMASRTLAQKLSGFTVGTNVLRLTGVSQSCVGVAVEDSGETVPLQPCLVTPPSSPDIDPKGSGMEWV